MEKFNYTYSAPTETERKEIENIKKRYETPTGESKIERLRRLDAKVKNGANIAALAVGIAPIVAAYPLYNFVLHKNKKKYGAEILKLSQELLNEK